MLSLPLLATAAALALPPGQLVFNGERDGNREIYRVTLPERKIERLTRNPGADEEPELSPDGCWVAWHTERGGNRDLYKMRPDGSGELRLTQDPAIDEDASWSADGSRIVFWSDRGGAENVYEVPAGGGRQTRLTRNRGRATMRVPALSPDGRFVAYTSNKSGSHQVHVLELEAQRDVALTAGRPGACRPDWSPNGKQIVYVHPEGKAGILSELLKPATDLWLQSPGAGGAPRKLTRDPHNHYDPSFSPDGRFVVFASDRHGDYDIFILELATGAELRITDWKGDERAPHWGPPCPAADLVGRSPSSGDL